MIALKKEENTNEELKSQITLTSDRNQLPKEEIKNKNRKNT